MILKSLKGLFPLLAIVALISPVLFTVAADKTNTTLTYLWPLPAEFTSGDATLSVDPALSLVAGGRGGSSRIVSDAFERYKSIIFKHGGGGIGSGGGSSSSTRESGGHSHSSFSLLGRFGRRARPTSSSAYDVSVLKIIVDSDNEELQLGVDESYTLLVGKSDKLSIVGEATIEANTVYGALRGLETFSQLCQFDYETKSVQIYQAPWYIRDEPRFEYRGLLIDTSRHYLPVDVIKHIIESMSYAKFNVLHWHIIDEESFPFEVPSYPNLWKGSYTKWERYTVEDAYDIVK
ncbi:Beta-hexosaminidase 1 [Turnera subulata]|uniref:beta-N-acetylhexosaminidase n=1 Tax=Turnera subulata TaxID=218843 RepID=A0A9Q0EZ49_9ROSI|nr:Beta-hexosaminidase 1 [Turnera subulata]